MNLLLFHLTMRFRHVIYFWIFLDKMNVSPVSMLKGAFEFG